MAHKQVTSGFQTCREALDQLRLSLMTEVDHHVSAEDQVEGADIRQTLNEVDAPKTDHFHDFRPHAIPAIPLAFAAQKMFPHPGNHRLLETLSRIQTFAGSFERSMWGAAP